MEDNCLDQEKPFKVKSRWDMHFILNWFVTVIAGSILLPVCGYFYLLVVEGDDQVLDLLELLRIWGIGSFFCFLISSIVSIPFVVLIGFVVNQELNKKPVPNQLLFGINTVQLLYFALSVLVLWTYFDLTFYSLLIPLPYLMVGFYTWSKWAQQKVETARQF